MAGNTRTGAVWTGSGDPFSLSESSAFAPGELGKVAFISNTTGLDPGQGPKIIQKVKRYATDTVAVASGDLAFWQDSDNYVVTGEPANAIGGTVRPLVAGVFGAATPSAGSFGYIQVSGVMPFRVADSTSASTTSAGAVLIWSTDRQVKKRTATDITTWLVEMHKPVVAVLRAGNNATTTNITVEGLLAGPIHSW